MMTDRERWIIYPLLFLALGTALKDKVVPREKIECRQLVATNIHTSAMQANAIQIRDPQGRPRIDIGVREGWLTAEKKKKISFPIFALIDDSRKPVFAINNGSVSALDIATQSVAVVDDQGKPRVKLGTQTYTLSGPVAEGEDAPTKVEVSQGMIQVLDEQGMPKISLDTIPAQIAQGDQQLQVSQGQIQVNGFANQPTAIVSSEMLVNNLAARQVAIRGAGDRPAMILVGRGTVDAEGKPTGKSTGHFILNGEDGKPVVVMSSVGPNADGAVEVLSGESQKRVSIRGDNAGGVVTTYHGTRDFDITLGNFDQFAGVLARSGATPLPYSRLITAQQLEQMPLREPAEAEEPAPDAAAEESSEVEPADADPADDEAADADDPEATEESSAPEGTATESDTTIETVDESTESNSAPAE